MAGYEGSHHRHHIRESRQPHGGLKACLVEKKHSHHNIPLPVLCHPIHPIHVVIQAN